jgi:hypothetical protein
MLLRAKSFASSLRVLPSLALLQPPTGRIFNSASGGASYLLNVATLDKLMTAMQLNGCTSDDEEFTDAEVSSTAWRSSVKRECSSCSSCDAVPRCTCMCSASEHIFAACDNAVCSCSDASLLLFQLLCERLCAGVCAGVAVVTALQDVMVAACLELLGVLPHDTRTALGEERFHPLAPEDHLEYRYRAVC